MIATATSVTGFLFPCYGMTPAIDVGIVALIILAIVLIAAQAFGARVRGPSSVQAVLLPVNNPLVFLAIAQAFGKIALLHAAASTLKDPPFAATQAVALATFMLLGIRVTKSSRFYRRKHLVRAEPLTAARY